MKRRRGREGAIVILKPFKTWKEDKNELKEGVITVLSR